MSNLQISSHSDGHVVVHDTVNQTYSVCEQIVTILLLCIHFILFNTKIVITNYII